MDNNLLDLYSQASEWTSAKVARTLDLDATTPCEEWRVDDLLNHMLETQRYFLSSARGESASPPGPNPPDLMTDDPALDFARGRLDTLAAFAEDGVIEKTGPALGIAFSDQLLHGWDLARATHQDSTMPDGLPEAAYEIVHGAFTDEQRVGVFKPEVPINDNASAQERLLAYTGRDPH